MRLDLVVGTRPNFVKVAPVIHELQRRIDAGSKITFRVVHTGQHYDDRLSKSFFEQLEIPSPNTNLMVGSGTHASQTADIMTRYEELLISEPADLCVVFGDVNSTLACAITAKKQGLLVGHVEAGLRSGDWSMPEEINRVVTDSISDYFFTTSRNASLNLERSGVDQERIVFVGNTMIDTLSKNLSRLRPPDFWSEFDYGQGEYFLLTLHRPSNVDSRNEFHRILNAINVASRQTPVLFPVHPRTRKLIGQDIHIGSNIILTEPQAYLEFNFLLKNSKAVITDSGGVTEEATFLGVPCLTIRDNTERPETLDPGTNVLVGSDSEAIKLNMDNIFRHSWKASSVPEMWDGLASQRIVDFIVGLK